MKTKKKRTANRRSAKTKRPGLTFVRVGAVQMISVNGNTPRNVAKALRFCDQAAKRGVQILCFPEMASTGFDWIGDERFKKLHAEPVPGPMVREFEEKAAQTGMYIIMGVLERPQRSRKYYNTAFVVGPTEGYLGKYRKINAEGVFAPGTEAPVFETAHGRIGIYICADIRKPEISRLLALRGATILFQPTYYFLRKKQVSQREVHRFCEGKFTSQRARAMENGLPLVVANAGWSGYVNNSCILGCNINGPPPFLARATRREQLITADVELDRNRNLAAEIKGHVDWLFEEMAAELRHTEKR